MSDIFFIRHAQASFGAANYDKLSEKGIQQAKDLGKYLAQEEWHFDQVFCGPLERQIHTCDEVEKAYIEKALIFPQRQILLELKEHSATEAMKMALPRLIENDPFVQKLQEDAAKNHERVKGNTMKIFQYFMEGWVNGKIEVPEYESWKAFRIAVREGLAKILNKVEKGQKVAAFTSGGTISCILAESLKMTDEERIVAMNLSIRNTAINQWKYSRGQFNLFSLNHLPHLTDEMITFV